MIPTLAGEWWHGNRKAVHSFLDGSARIGDAGQNVSNWYSMHMISIDAPNSTWRWPRKQ
jgi:hypothetical protein